MYRYLAALCAVLACLALAAPAMAQEPTIKVTTTCMSGGTTNFFVEVTGLNPGEPAGFMAVDASGEAQMSAAIGGTTEADGSVRIGFGGSIAPGTYTIYAYTGPYQTLGEAGDWPGAIEVDAFDPSLTTSLVSTQVESNCGPPTKEQCKLGGFADEGYRNQGQCVSASAPGRQ
jgi:hypothetical protein